MHVRVNGDAMDLPDATTVEALLGRLKINWQGGRVAVEVNLDVVPKGEYPSRTLTDGDTIEIVRFVGGG